MNHNPYSFSKITLFKKCPLKWKYTYIDKIATREPTVATERGSYIHHLLEYNFCEEHPDFNFILLNEEQIKECHEIFKNFKESKLGKEFLEKEGEKKTEVEFAIKKEKGKLIPCDYNDKDAIFRGKIDYLIKGKKLVIVDWKTGKVPEKPDILQVAMYAAWAFLSFDIQKVETNFIYVEHGVKKQYVFNRKQLPIILKNILKNIMLIEKEKEFKKKESPLCEYCEFRKNGICKEESGKDFSSKYIFNYNRKTKK